MAAPIDLEAYQAEAEDFLAALSEEYYLNSAGLKEDLELEALYERHQGLFTSESVAALLQRARNHSSGLEGGELALFAAEGFLEHSVKGLTEAIQTGETRDTVSWDGEQISWRLASVRCSQETDPVRRHRLDDALLEQTAARNPQRRERLRRLHVESRRLGFGSYAEIYDQLRHLDLAELQGWTERLLLETAGAYAKRLPGYLAEVGVSPQEARVSDVRALARGRPFDGLFPREQLLASLDATLEGMGLDLQRQPNVHLDTEERPLKSPRAFCAAVRVPGDIRLVIMPKGGQDDYHALLHEAGHTEHFAHCDPQAGFAARRLGDSSVTECFAFLFEHLTHSAAWLKDVLRLDTQASRPYLAYSRFLELFMLRRYSAKLAYERELHQAGSAPLDDMPERYVAVLGGATLLRTPAQNWVADVDDGFYVAQYLRAWILEAQLRAHLEKRFGERWYTDREAGELLRSLWRPGQAENAPQMAARLGMPGLDPGPLIRELAAG